MNESAFVEKNKITSEISLWQKNVYYSIGDVVLYKALIYMCIYAHKSLCTLAPSFFTTLLWKFIETNKSNVTNWKVSIFYNIGDVIEYNNIIYTCIRAHLSFFGFEPNITCALWKKIDKK